jgi:methylated-DNA-protein-cysteine methyltransferase-like protein
MKGFHAQVYEIVARIPSGKVVTYGQIAIALGRPHHARVVGWAMHRCPPGLPWHRVINSQGRISLTGPSGAQQRARLEAEGIVFCQGRVDLDRYQWRTRR